MKFKLIKGKLRNGAGEETRTLTPKAPEPKSGASTNFATPAKSVLKMGWLEGLEPSTTGITIRDSTN